MHRLQGLALAFWGNRQLVWRLSKRELATRYRGSMLGAFWLVVTPLLMLGVYSFTFQVVFKARWSTEEVGTADFALFLFAGLVVFGVFGETVNRAPGLMLENVSYIKKVVFPLEILPVVTLVVALCNLAVGLAVLLAFYLPFRGLPPATALQLPLVLVPLCLISLGLSWFLASVGVFLRDIRHLVGVAVMALMFLSPVFYPISSVPATIAPYLQLNPLTPILEQTRDVLFWNRSLDWIAWLQSMLIGVAVAGLGLAWFLKTRKAFADVV